MSSNPTFLHSIFFHRLKILPAEFFFGQARPGSTQPGETEAHLSEDEAGALAIGDYVMLV